MEKPDYYFHGDACRWTGKTSKELGRLWYHYEILEGHRKGDIVQQMGKPYKLMKGE